MKGRFPVAPGLRQCAVRCRVVHRRPETSSPMLDCDASADTSTAKDPQLTHLFWPRSRTLRLYDTKQVTARCDGARGRAGDV